MIDHHMSELFRKPGFQKAIPKNPVSPKMFRNGALHAFGQKRERRTALFFLDIEGMLATLFGVLDQIVAGALCP
jgi:hypothetical protein